MKYQTLLFDVRGTIGIIRLNRPDRMNAVIEGMYLELRDVFGRIRNDNQVRAVILTGTVRIKDEKSRQVFCAGADLKEHGSGSRTFEQKKSYLELAHNACHDIYDCPKPTIAVLNGAARGAGTEMALNCDFIFMAEDATLAFPETSLGTCIGGGASRHLVDVLGLSRAKDLVYTGRVIHGTEAFDLGLAHSCHPIDVLMDEALSFAQRLSAHAPVSMALVKRLMHQSATMDLKAVLNEETQAILDCMKTEDWHEGVKAFAEKRKPVYKGK